jgi:serine/threonine protein kinase
MRLSAPYAMLLAMPLLIALTAGGVLVISDSLSRRGACEQSEVIFSAASRAAGLRLRDVLAQVDPVLDGLRGSLTDPEPSNLARSLRPLVAGRPGIVRAYIAWPDGRVAGIEKGGDAWSLFEITPNRSGAAMRLRLLSKDGGIGAAGPETDLKDFDIRKRPWWQQAVDRRLRSWTDPYMSGQPAQPGITCSEPILGGDGSIGAVLAADYELSALGSALSGSGKFSHVLFDAQRTIIGLPEEWARSLPTERLPAPLDVGQPALTGFFQQMHALPAAGTPAVFAWQADGEPYEGIVQAIPIPSGPTWYLGQIVPSARLTGKLDEARRLSLTLGAVAVLIGAGLSAWFASQMWRSRRDAELQRARATAAEAELRQLGAYRLVRKLGQGGMGEVWLGMHRLLARPAAIKRITAARLTGGDAARAAEAQARFSTEARITASLRSRNTIELYDYGISPDGGFFYVMELLDGLDLRELVEKHGPPPIGRTIHLLLQVCNSLAEAHDRGLVHRDIKPENIYTCRRADEVDVVKVLDFGIVAVQSRELGAKVSKAGFVVGTPTTMSPEQARGEPLDGRSDLYALGCVAYWLLTGSQVFLEEDQMPLIMAHVNDMPEAPSQRAARAMPLDLDSLVLACLSKSREMRPADARALATALRAIAVPESEAWPADRAAAWWAAKIPSAPAGVFDQGPDASGLRSSDFDHSKVS